MLRYFALMLIVAASLCAGSVRADTAKEAAAATAAPATTAATAAPATRAVTAAGTAPAADSPVAVLTAEQVIQILDQTVDWYRTLGTQQQNATQPSDLLILFANRQTADQVVALAFDIARANAELLSSEANAAPDGAEPSSTNLFIQQESQVDAQRAALQEELKRGSSANQPALQGELAVLNARKNLLDTMSEFIDQSNPKGAGANALKAHIDAIAVAIPGSNSAAIATPAAAPSSGTPAATAAAAPPLNDNKPAPARSGIWDLGTTVLNLGRKIKTIEAVDEHTAALAATFSAISAPPLKQLKSYTARSDALATQAHDADAAAQKALRAQFDTLAWLFKQTSAILLPLNKEQVLLQQYRHNLGNWRTAAQAQYYDALQALGVRVAILAGILVVVYGLAELWRRGVLRYVHEPRRRYQLLLVQRIIFWAATISIIGLSFATEISSFATFAGLLTAGVAVAMQSVLVSVVGYFFLIGKYGIRVGDRIQIGTVVGQVIDIGLVRMHLMELNSSGPLGPTGRVVAFANLIVFQASGGLFKQIPGVTLSWHESTLSLPEGRDYAALKDELLAAVTAVVGEYQDEIIRQTREIERSTATSSATDAIAQVQMHLVDNRMVALIRYPVHLEHAAQIDERVAEAVLKIIDAARPAG